MTWKHVCHYWYIHDLPAYSLCKSCSRKTSSILRHGGRFTTRRPALPCQKTRGKCNGTFRSTCWCMKKKVLVWWTPTTGSMDLCTPSSSLQKGLRTFHNYRVGSLTVRPYPSTRRRW